MRCWWRMTTWFWTVFGMLRKVGVVRILTGGVGIDVVQRMRPGVAEQRREAMAEGVRNIQVKCVVVEIPIVDVGLDDAVWRRVGIGCSTSRTVLGVPVDPVRTRAVGSLRCADLVLRGADEW